MIGYSDVATCLQNATAWTCWWSGFQLGQDVALLGWSIMWWARLGKFLQFVAGTFILLEIAGPEKLSAWSQAIGKWPTPFRRVGMSPRKVAAWSWTFLKALPKLGLVLSIILMPLGFLWLLLGHLGVISLPALPSIAIASPGDALASTVLSVVVAVAIALLALLAAYSILISLLTKVVEWISRGLAFVTGHPQLQSRAKFAGWAVFVLGFWLDFLAS